MPLLDLGPDPNKALSEPVYYGDGGGFRAATMLGPAGFRVGAAMHYPGADAEAARNAYIAAREARVAAAIREERDRQPEGSERWRKYNQLYRQWKDGTFERAGGLAALLRAHRADMEPRPKPSQGDYAGLMLLHILERAERCPAEASVNKVCDYLERALVRDKSLAASRAHIFRVWTEFMSVAHLWGAHVLWELETRRCGSCQTTLGAFLATAETLRKRGEQFHPRGRKVAKSRPILHPEEPWRVPPGLALPSVTISLPRPSPVLW